MTTTTAFDRRAEVVADPTLGGRALCRALSAATDAWVVELFEAATDGVGRGRALVAVGGYGRGELAPGSDLDLWLLHDGKGDVGPVAEALWYPIWDSGLKLGHAVRTPKQALKLAADDLETATAALSLRFLAGDPALVDGLADKALAQWRKRSSRWLPLLAQRVADRHAVAGEVAFLLEPDVKEGRGGLRDIHALDWAERGSRVLLPGDAGAMADAEELLLTVRVALHRLTGRRSDVLLLERQDEVAEAIGERSADTLMARVATAARTVAWTADETWHRLSSSVAGPAGRAFGRDRSVGAGLVVRDGQVHLTAEVRPADDASLVLRAGAAAAREGVRIDRASLDALAAASPALDGPWPAAARQALVDLLVTGSAAIPVLEALDQRGLLVRVLPEWAPTRSRPQRNALHRFTVDRHLCEAAANAAALVGTVARPDLLLVGAWLHDLGKGYPGDHSVVGVDLMQTVATRMGFPPDDVALLAGMVAHHLLLPDVATRRDLDDCDVIDAVAADVGSLELLELLAALAEADGLATGPSAWGVWKAELVGELVARTAHVLRGGVAVDVAQRSFPPHDVAALMAAGRTVVSGDGSVLTVVTSDRPGVFSRVAGTLALRSVAVLAADAATDENGMAASRFRVDTTSGEVDWEAVGADIARALDGRLALEARLAERARVYRRVAPGAALVADPSVRIDNNASSTCTVVEVRARDGVGRLYRITRAFADLDLDICTARISTLGEEAVDTFYVRTSSGRKLTERDHLRELERAVLHQVSLS